MYYRLQENGEAIMLLNNEEEKHNSTYIVNPDNDPHETLEANFISNISHSNSRKTTPSKLSLWYIFTESSIFRDWIHILEMWLTLRIRSPISVNSLIKFRHVQSTRVAHVW